MSASKLTVTSDGINMHDPMVYYLIDHVGDYSDTLLLIGNVISHVRVFNFVILVFIPAKKHEGTKPSLKRCGIDELSFAIKDGIIMLDSVTCKHSKNRSAIYDVVDEIQEAYTFRNGNTQQNFVIVVSPNNHGGLKVEYKFLKVDDIPNVVRKQLQTTDDKIICSIDTGTHQEFTKQCLDLLLNKKQSTKTMSKRTPGGHVSVPDPAKGRKLNYDELEDRMKTFKLPPEWHGPLDYQSMAEAGFVYTGQEDLVFCFHCNIKLDRWFKDMEPLLRHKEESPTCSFMRQRLQAVKGERGKTKSVVAPSKPLNSRLTSSIGQLQSSSLVTSKSIHTVVTGLNEPRLSYGGSFDDRPGASLPITPENYQCEAERIKSFVGWPLNEAVHPEQLARVGFVYSGEGALVQCFQCGVKYRHWYKGDVPLNIHQKCNPRCAFLQSLGSKSKSLLEEQRPTRSYIQPESLDNMNAQTEEVSKHSLQFPDYSDQAVRLQSFKHWGGILPVQELAEGGFYMIARRDVVKCFSCKVVVQDWERSDNVIDEHHKHSPHCPFLKESFLSTKRNSDMLSPYSSIEKTSQSVVEKPVIKSRDSHSPQLPGTSEILSGPDVKLLPSMKSRCSSKSPDDDQEEEIPGIRYPPSWGQHRSMSPQGTTNCRKTSLGSDESFHSAESHHKADYTMMTSLDPPKTKIMYEESLSEGLENNISIKTGDTKGDDMGAPGMGICQICYDKKIDCIFLPCGHARTCEGCATRIKNSGQPCPYCRKGVSTTYRIYL